MSEDPPIAQADLRGSGGRGRTRTEANGRKAATLRLSMLSVLGLAVGIVTGLGAVFFRDLIGVVHNLLFLGKIQIAYDANLFTPASPWGAFVILVPVLGALIVTFLVEKFAPEARGHGVPEVIDAIYYKRGAIRPIVAAVKSVASAVAIGSGAAVGREGPIIQIGSALGSTLGNLTRLLPSDRIVLVAAGAGAGIAATFNTPIGGVLFAIELMLPEVSVQSFLPVALATGTATFVAEFFFGQRPAFAVPDFAAFHLGGFAVMSLVLYGVLGLLAGLASAAFVLGLQRMTELFDRIGQRYLRHAFGMLLVGILFYLLNEGFGHYYVEGVGYATIQSILTGQLGFLPLLALLFACKLFATTVSLGSGSSGGIFSPSLFMGAAIGAAFGAFLSTLSLPVPISVPAFAMVGMGAMMGGSTGAVMTAVAMIFEMTRDYHIVLPMILAVAVSVGVRRLFSAETIYTMKLFRRGQLVPKALHANLFLVRRAHELMDSDIVIAPADADFATFVREAVPPGRTINVVVTDADRIYGVLAIGPALSTGLQMMRAGTTLGEAASRDFTIVRENQIASSVIRRLSRRQAQTAVVVHGRGIPDAADVLGVITKAHVADAVSESMQIYPG